jgi:hypothetical protein
LEKRLELHDKLAERAITKAEENLALRLDGMNEFRAQLTAQAATFVTREEFGVHMKNVEEKIVLLTKMIYIGIGILVTIQVLWRFIK